MFQGRVGPLNVYMKTTLGSADMPFVQFNANAMDVIELMFTFQAVGKLVWSFQILKDIDAEFLTHNDNLLAASPVDAETYCQSCLARVNTAGRISVFISPETADVFRNSVSNVMLSARKIGQASLDSPTSAPSYDSTQWWARIRDLTEKTQKWVAGYKVKYAVSFYNGGIESSKGPWSDWISDDTFAWPRLVNIPIGQSPVKGRNIYRQFDGFPEELIITLENNTDVLCPDTNL